MLLRKIPINLWNLVSPLAKTFDLMNPALGDHCLRVAYLAMRLAEELEWPAWRRREVAIAGALEAAGATRDDVGAIAIAGQLDGCVPVDDAGDPVAPAIIWEDRRATAEARRVDAARRLRTPALDAKRPAQGAGLCKYQSVSRLAASAGGRHEAVQAEVYGHLRVLMLQMDGVAVERA